VDHNKAGCKRQLKCLPADARGPQQLGLVNSLLTQLNLACVGVAQPDGQDLGYKQ
jgi:hypothetical protein